jgi:predicted secreted hydrolase
VSDTRRTRRARAAARGAGQCARPLVALALGLAGAWPCGAASAQDASTRGAPMQVVAPVLDAEGFVRATPGRPLHLPADHGSHPETRTEWWYLTGTLSPDGGEGDGPAFGFQATWFRRALVAAVPPGRSPLAVRDVLLYHGALTDVAAGSLALFEQTCRAYPLWAHASPGELDVALLGSSLVTEADGAARLRCRAGDGELDLQLDLSRGAPLLHGEEPGLSRKGEQPGQASWYYSLPRVPLRGTLRRPGRADLAVSGSAWFDHEFGSSQLSAQQVGWDWFSVALDDGSDLMLYRLRLADGGADATSSATFRAGGDAGAGRHMPRDEYHLTETGRWTSPRTGATYPSGWRLVLPREALELSVVPIVRDQELLTPGSTGVSYWEGLCRFTGTRAGVAVSGNGYVELVGYERSFTGRL